MTHKERAKQLYWATGDLADDEEIITTMEMAIENAVLVEREACATLLMKRAEEMRRWGESHSGVHHPDTKEEIKLRCKELEAAADEIRARGGV